MDTGFGSQFLSRPINLPAGAPKRTRSAGENGPIPNPERQDGTGSAPEPIQERSISTATETPPEAPDPATVRADVTLRSCAAFTDWLAAVAAEERVSMAVMIELALVRFAKEEGYEPPPTRIPARPTVPSGRTR